MNIDSELKMRMTMMMMVMMMMIMTAIRIMMNLNEEELGLSSKGGASVGCERLPNLDHYHNDDLDDDDDRDEDDDHDDHNDEDIKSMLPCVQDRLRHSHRKCPRCHGCSTMSYNTTKHNHDNHLSTTTAIIALFE